MTRRTELRLPDLGFGDREVTLSIWLVETGRAVTEGDRLVEVLSGSATVDLPAPASGVLEATFAAEDEIIAADQLLAVIASDD